jgi:hypothetical protein
MIEKREGHHMVEIEKVVHGSIFEQMSNEY